MKSRYYRFVIIARNISGEIKIYEIKKKNGKQQKLKMNKKKLHTFRKLYYIHMYTPTENEV